MFPVDDVEWRKWMNQDCYKRQGIGFLEMTDAQREAALGLMHASLSAEGLKLARDIMHLDTTLGQLSNNNFARYGEGRYWITVMGEPSPDQPWGWQIDGHHLVINYFVLGDQVVMSPVFLGSEPGIAKSGKYAGTAILQREQAGGLAFLRGLDDAQRAKAVLSVSKISTTTSASVQGQRGPRLRRRARGCAHRHATRAVARAIRNNPAPTTTAPMARAMRSPAGARRSTVMAAATTAIARRSMTPMTRRSAIRPAQQWLQWRPRRRPCRQAVPASACSVRPRPGASL